MFERSCCSSQRSGNFSKMYIVYVQITYMWRLYFLKDRLLWFGAILQYSH